MGWYTYRHLFINMTKVVLKLKVFHLSCGMHAADRLISLTMRTVLPLFTKTQFNLITLYSTLLGRSESSRQGDASFRLCLNVIMASKHTASCSLL